MPVKGDRPAWRNNYYVRVYKMAQMGLKNGQIAQQLGVSKATFKSWVKADKALRESLKEAREPKEVNQKVGSLSEFVYQRLPADLRPLWDTICEADEEPNGERRLELLTANCGELAKQHLWLHALVTKNFNKNEACRVTNIGKSLVAKWVKEDPQFLELVDEIVDMKHDFVEGALMNLVAGGDSAATIFAAKTLLRKRGYDVKTTVEVSGQVNHSHGHVDLTKVLDGLDLDSRRKLLMQLPAHRETNDATQA